MDRAALDGVGRVVDGRAHKRVEEVDAAVDRDQLRADRRVERRGGQPARRQRRDEEVVATGLHRGGDQQRFARLGRQVGELARERLLDLLAGGHRPGQRLAAGELVGAQRARDLGQRQRVAVRGGDQAGGDLVGDAVRGLGRSSSAAPSSSSGATASCSTPANASTTSLAARRAAAGRRPRRRAGGRRRRAPRATRRRASGRRRRRPAAAGPRRRRPAATASRPAPRSGRTASAAPAPARCRARAPGPRGSCRAAAAAASAAPAGRRTGCRTRTRSRASGGSEAQLLRRVPGPGAAARTCRSRARRGGGGRRSCLPWRRSAAVLCARSRAHGPKHRAQSCHGHAIRRGLSASPTRHVAWPAHYPLGVHDSFRRPRPLRQHPAGPAGRWLRAPSPIQEQAIPPMLAGRGRHRPGPDRLRQDRRLRPADHRVRRPDRARGAGARPHARRASSASRSPRRCAPTPRARAPTSSPSSAARRSARQQAQLKAGGHIVVGTVGRVLDLINRRSLVLDCRFVVLDEADEMLDLGFLEDVEKILRAHAQQPPDRAVQRDDAAADPQARRQLPLRPGAREGAVRDADGRLGRAVPGSRSRPPTRPTSSSRCSRPSGPTRRSSSRARRSAPTSSTRR